MPVIIFNLMPRIMVAIIFFLELIIYNRIHYFLISLPLLLLLILWNIFLNLYINFAVRGLIELPKSIKITPIGEPSTNGWYNAYDFGPLSQYHYEKNDIKEYADTFIIVIKMYCFGAGNQSFKTFQQQISPYITLLTSSLYLFSSIYKLIYILS